MGASIQPHGGRARRARRTRVHEINVTPLVDVMMVLLVIFMVSAPLLTTGVEVNLPRAAGDTLDGQAETLRLSVDSSGTYFLGTDPIPPGDLLGRLVAVRNANPGIALLVAGDAGVPWEFVLYGFAVAKQAGFAGLSFETDREQVRRRVGVDAAAPATGNTAAQ